MTITLNVREVLCDPTLFVSNWRLGVVGVLLLTDDDFRILQSDDGEPVETLALRIVDPFAAQKAREVLPQPPAGGWWYFGRGYVQAWTRDDPDGWVPHDVVSISLDEMEGDREVRVKVGPHPWGWDQFEK